MTADLGDIMHYKYNTPQTQGLGTQKETCHSHTSVALQKACHCCRTETDQDLCVQTCEQVESCMNEYGC